MENKENNVEQQPKAETTKKNRVKSVVKTVLILATATALGVWYGKRGFKGMGNDVKTGFNKVTGAVKNAMPKKSEQANVEVEVREPRNEYRGHHNHGNRNNNNYNN